jgi:hypothetical protein
MLNLKAYWNEYKETKVYSTKFGGGGCTVKRVARYRITFKHHKNISSFFLFGCNFV